MSEMFKNYPQPEDYIPDNRPKFLTIDEKDTIIRGGTCYHTIDLPFNWSENVFSEKGVVGIEYINKVIYCNGLNNILEKFEALNEFEIIEDEDKTYIRIKLTPEETQLFKLGKTTQYQLSLRLKNSDIMFTKRCDVKVINTLAARGEDE